ncbi:MAG: hypothetical protein AB1510_12700 [Bacillota bacterium]
MVNGILRRWTLYLFGAYNIAAGFTALISPSCTAVLYSVPSVSPEFIGTCRWVGALSIAIGYGAFSAVKSGDRRMINLVLISAVMMIIGSAWSVADGVATWANIGVDSAIQAVAIVALLIPQKVQKQQQMTGIRRLRS